MTGGGIGCDGVFRTQLHPIEQPETTRGWIMFPHGSMPRESPGRSRQGSFGPEGRSTVGKLPTNGVPPRSTQRALIALAFGCRDLRVAAAAVGDAWWPRSRGGGLHPGVPTLEGLSQ